MIGSSSGREEMMNKYSTFILFCNNCEKEDDDEFLERLGEMRENVNTENHKPLNWTPNTKITFY